LKFLHHYRHSEEKLCSVSTTTHFITERV